MKLTFLGLILLGLTVFNRQKLEIEPVFDPDEIVLKTQFEDTVIKQSSCPEDMVPIEGDYCPNVEEICLYNIDSNGNRLPGPGTVERACGEFQKPTRCLKNKIHMKFCIDRFEFPNKFGEKPRDWMTYFDAKRELESIGKRLCSAREWTFVAQGPEMKPIPYGDGYHRNNNKCNIGVKAPDIDRFKATSTNQNGQLLREFLKPSGSLPECVSDFQVFDLSGNIDEIVENEGGDDCINKTTGNCRSGLKGGHWIANVRNASTPITSSHGSNFSWWETGTRGCKDVND